MRNDLQTLLKQGLPMEPGPIQIGERSRSQIGHESGSKVRLDLRASSQTRLDSIVRTHVLPEFGDYALNRVGNSVFAHGLPA